MPDIELTQAEALLAMEKHRTEHRQLNFPVPGERLVIPLRLTG